VSSLYTVMYFQYFHKFLFCLVTPNETKVKITPTKLSNLRSASRYSTRAAEAFVIYTLITQQYVTRTHFGGITQIGTNPMASHGLTQLIDGTAAFDSRRNPVVVAL